MNDNQTNVVNYQVVVSNPFAKITSSTSSGNGNGNVNGNIGWNGRDGSSDGGPTDATIAEGAAARHLRQPLLELPYL